MGHLGQDPELRHTGSGTAVCNFAIATNERWRDKQGNQQERTEWHQIVVWGAQAEATAKWRKKGDPILLEGKLKTDKWTDKDTGKDRYSTKVVAESVKFLNRKGDSDSGGSYQDHSQNNSRNNSNRPTSRPKKVKQNDDFGDEFDGYDGSEDEDYMF
jgi:single-strand DNA-binding protein